MKNVSVVVITYNEEKNIEDCLNSLVSQDYPEDKYEIIVVDASTDKTKELASKFSNVIVHKSKEKGFAVQRNLGIKLAKNELIASTDADCIAPSDWLKKLVESLEKNNVSGVSGSAFPPKDSGYIGLCIACLGFPAGGALGLTKNDPISIGNSIFYKKVLEDVNGFNPKLKYGGEDTDLTRRLKEKGCKIIIEPEIFVYHKTRDFGEFLSWCFRRGRAKFHLSKNPVQVLMPLSVLIYPFTSKFWRVVTKRKGIKIDLFSVFLVVPCLFFLRQVFMTLGWSYEFTRCFGRKEKY